MSAKPIAILGIYSDRSRVEDALVKLENAGVRNVDISVLFSNVGAEDSLGGALGWLVGIGTLSLPGLGSFIAAGPIAEVLGEARVGENAVGVAGALILMEVPEYTAKGYEGRILEGDTLLTVHCDDSNWTRNAKRILDETGAEDVTSTGEATVDYSKSERPMPRTRDSLSD